MKKIIRLTEAGQLLYDNGKKIISLMEGTVAQIRRRLNRPQKETIRKLGYRLAIKLMPELPRFYDVTHRFVYQRWYKAVRA